MTPPTPRKLDLKKTERLRIEWSDGTESVYPLTYLRQMCPCAVCKMMREGRDPHQLFRPATPEEMRAQENAAGDASPAPTAPPKAEKKPLSLNVLPRQFASAADTPTVESAELVGNYALRLHWSDTHDSGIYSFAYLREIDR